MTLPITRRRFLQTTACSAVAPVLATSSDLDGEVGITCATLAAHMQPQNPKGFSLTELPKVARDELGMRVLDLATTNLPSYEAAFLEQVRNAAENKGCLLTNLKLNQPGLDLGSVDEEVRAQSLKTYRESINAAALLGMRWARPLPTKDAPQNRAHFIDGMRRLADYAKEKGLTLLVENYGWMQSDPNSVVDLISDIDRNLPASPDTGNWNSNEIRSEGLARTFPLAVTCDFKAKNLGPNGEHEAYDLERCFRIGEKAGFKGPWCIEHGHAERETLFRELRFLRDQLHSWMESRFAAHL